MVPKHTENHYLINNCHKNLTIYRPRVSENRVLNKIFGPERKVVTGDGKIVY